MRPSSDSADGLVSGESTLVTPKPAWVIKVMRTNGEKIFINLCEHGDIPQAAVSMGYNKWPFMVLTPVRTVQDEKGESTDRGSVNADKKSTEISIYDAVVNPAVIQLGAKEPAAKDAVSIISSKRQSTRLIWYPSDLSPSTAAAAKEFRRRAGVRV